MRIAGRLLVALSLLSACSAAARADDFKMNILDPPPPAANPNYHFANITATPFSFTFGDCPALPGGASAEGCLIADNGTNTDIIGVTFFVPNSFPTAQTAACGGGDPGQIFPASGISCNPNPNGNDVFVLNFTGGVISPGELFFITEDGVPPADFPTVDVTLDLASSGVTPEPSSIALLGTGLAGLSSALWTRRRVRA